MRPSVARNWSEDAVALFEAFPWQSDAEKARARSETELVAFGACVERDDLPLAVRKWGRRRQTSSWTWRGESWAESVAAFERAILSQALASCGGNVAAAARALRTTPRIVAYKARKVGLIPKARRHAVKAVRSDIDGQI